MAKLAVIIPAAGSGTRMGSRLPKPFIELHGKSILALTISQFLKVEHVVQIIIATSRDWTEHVGAICSGFDANKVRFDIVEGGSERQFSINNALNFLSDEVELVAIHDAVRPFIKPALINKCSQIADKSGGAIIAVPAKDTIKKTVDGESISSTPDRKELWQAQTPQIFKKEIIVRAYTEAIEDRFLGTDDASLVERIGCKVKLVEGDRENLKITYPVDLKIAELILNEEKI